MQNENKDATVSLSKSVDVSLLINKAIGQAGTSVEKAHGRKRR